MTRAHRVPDFAPTRTAHADAGAVPVAGGRALAPRGISRLRMLTVATLLAGTSGWVQAQSLVELFEAARQFDATYLAAQAQFTADQARAEQAKAGLRANVGLNGGALWTNTNSSFNPLDRTSNSQNVALAGSYPLYRPANEIAAEQAEKSLVAAQASLQSAEQDLIVRTAQAYFDVLTAEDNLTFVQAQKTAVAEQLAAAKRNFEVGASTITDTREAEARFDLVVAQEIAAQNNVRVARLALDQLVGRTGTQPWRLKALVALPAVEPAEVTEWVNRSQSEHPQIRAAAAGLEIAQLEVRRADAGRKPTLDAVAQYQVNRGLGNSLPASYVRNQNASVGVQFNLPLYTGNAVQNQVKEAMALEERAGADLEATRRTIAQATRAAYFGVVSGQGQVKALEAAEVSSQSALDANRLGYQVGVRINIDVLNAQSQLFQTKANLASARYNVLVGGLRLRQASGVLQATDLQPINALLAR